MSRRYEEDEAPILGDIKGGYVLVCHGDDSPTEWINWLSQRNLQQSPVKSCNGLGT